MMFTEVYLLLSEAQDQLEEAATITSDHSQAKKIQDVIDMISSIKLEEAKKQDE